MNSSIHLARIRGIPVEIHFSWLLVFFLFSVALAGTYFPAQTPGLSQTSYWAAGVITTLLVFTSVLVHEFGHSLVALKEGIPIKKIVLFIFGGVAQMESEPGTPAAEFKITVAGPLTSLAIGLFFLALHIVMPRPDLIREALFFLGRLNLIVAAFNMIPAFPLDGGRVLRSALWFFNKNMLKATRTAVAVGSFLSIIAMGLGFMMILFQGQLWGLWLIFLGWMIHQAGQSSYSQLVFQQTFSGVKVGSLMSTSLVTVSPDMTLDELADFFLHHKYGAFPVVFGSTTHGLVSLQSIKDVTKDKWPHTRVMKVMSPLKDCLLLSADTDAAGVMMKMASKNIGRALVMDGGELIGLLSRTDMMRFIQMHMVLGSE